MGRSPLATAAYDLDLNKVQALLAAGAPADGSTEERFDDEAPGCITGAPYRTPLGEACRSTSRPVKEQLAVIEALLAAGAPVDEPDLNGNTALLHAAAAGRAEVINRLVAAGADRHAAGGDGNAVARLLRLYLPDEPGGPKVRALRSLLHLGVDPRGGLSGKWGLLDLLDDPCEDLAGRDREARTAARAYLELMELLGEAAPDWAELQDWLARARAARLEGDAARRKRLARFEQLREQVGSPGFEKAWRKQLGKTPRGRFEELEDLAEVVLCAPAVIADPAWPTRVRELLALTPAYADLTEDAYGERMDVAAMDQDEGGVPEMIEDERLSTVEHCLRACACPEALARPDLADLVEELARTKQERLGAMSLGEAQAVALIAALDAAAHPRAADLAAHLRAAWPLLD